MEVYGVVYLIVNMVNGKRYVGQTIQPLAKRFNAHAYADSLIGKAIRKYGKENFHCGVIKTCTSKAELNATEKHFIAVLNCKAPYGYNLTDGGEGIAGLKRSSETRAKISIAQIGEKHHFFCKHHTSEQKAQIASKLKGKKRPPEVGKKISATKKGTHFSAKHCLSMSIAQRGYSPYKNLIAELDAHKFSYHHLAALLNLSQASVSMKISGKRNFTARDKIKLEEIFGKPAEYLLQRDDE